MDASLLFLAQAGVPDVGKEVLQNRPFAAAYLTFYSLMVIAGVPVGYYLLTKCKAARRVLRHDLRWCWKRPWGPLDVVIVILMVREEIQTCHILRGKRSRNCQPMQPDSMMNRLEICIKPALKETGSI